MTCLNCLGRPRGRCLVCDRVEAVGAPGADALAAANARIADLEAALAIACRRGCDHCADDIRKARAALSDTEKLT